MLITNFLFSLVIAFIVQFGLFRNAKYSFFNALIFATIVVIVEYILSIVRIEGMDNLPEQISVKDLRDPNLKVDSSMDTPDNLYLSSDAPVVNTEKSKAKTVSKTPKTNSELQEIAKVSLSNKETTNKTEDDLMRQYTIMSPKYWLDNDVNVAAACDMKCSTQPVIMGNDTGNLVRIDNIKQLIK